MIIFCAFLCGIKVVFSVTLALMVNSYPSGNVAVIITSFEKEKYQYILQKVSIQHLAFIIPCIPCKFFNIWHFYGNFCSNIRIYDMH